MEGKCWIVKLLYGEICFGRSVFPFPSLILPCVLLAKGDIVGFVEALQKEVAHLGIETIIFEPGEFRTGILGKADRESEFVDDGDYGEMVARVRRGLSDSDGKQRGDPRKGARVMVDVINGESVAMGKMMPGRLPLGRECLETVRRKCVETLRLCDEWEEVIGSTEFADVRMN